MYAHKKYVEWNSMHVCRAIYIVACNFIGVVFYQDKSPLSDSRHLINDAGYVLNPGSRLRGFTMHSTRSLFDLRQKILEATIEDFYPFFCRIFSPA